MLGLYRRQVHACSIHTVQKSIFPWPCMSEEEDEVKSPVDTVSK